MMKDECPSFLGRRRFEVAGLTIVVAEENWEELGRTGLVIRDYAGVSCANWERPVFPAVAKATHAGDGANRIAKSHADG
jgi:hypothetical protein